VPPGPGSAIHKLRRPPMFETQAKRDYEGAARRSVVKGALSACSMVNGADWPDAASVPKMNAFAVKNWISAERSTSAPATRRFLLNFKPPQESPL
jgi:hypothetical protein